MIDTENAVSLEMMRKIGYRRATNSQWCSLWVLSLPDVTVIRGIEHVYCCRYSEGINIFFTDLEAGIADAQGYLLGHVPDEHWDELRAIFALKGWT